MSKVYKVEILTEEMGMLGSYSGTRTVTRLYFTTQAQDALVGRGKK